VVPTAAAAGQDPSGFVLTDQPALMGGLLLVLVLGAIGGTLVWRARAVS
jgi:hypothetical protein